MPNPAHIEELALSLGEYSVWVFSPVTRRVYLFERGHLLEDVHFSFEFSNECVCPESPHCRHVRAYEKIKTAKYSTEIQDLSIATVLNLINQHPQGTARLHKTRAEILIEGLSVQVIIKG